MKKGWIVKRIEFIDSKKRDMIVLEKRYDIHYDNVEIEEVIENSIYEIL